MTEKITFFTAEGTPQEYYIIEQTVLEESTYLLVSDKDPEDEDALGFIFKEVTTKGDDSIYEPIEDERELAALSGIFSELLADGDLTLES